MSKKTSKKQEIDHFKRIANEWWLPNGKFKILHQITPIRMDYILKNFKNRKIQNLKVLDLGCGGGLICEPLARLNAQVTGIDLIKQNIEIAKEHSKNSNLNINYIHTDLDYLNLKNKYDLILLLEVIEHLDDWPLIIKKIKKNLKPKGKLIISTINRTILSNIFAIFVAENITKWVPKNTHDYKKLVTPDELTKVLNNNNFVIKDFTGMNYLPFSREWKLNKNLLSINYFCTAVIN